MYKCIHIPLSVFLNLESSNIDGTVTYRKGLWEDISICMCLFIHTGVMSDIRNLHENRNSALLDQTPDLSSPAVCSHSCQLIAQGSLPVDVSPWHIGLQWPSYCESFNFRSYLVRAAPEEMQWTVFAVLFFPLYLRCNQLSIDGRLHFLSPRIPLSS